MTSSRDAPGGRDADAPRRGDWRGAAGPRTRQRWHAADAIVSYLLVVALTMVNIFVAILLYIGAGLASDCHGRSCASSDPAIRAVVIAGVLLVLSMVVAYGGVLYSDARHRLMIWAPVAGFAITLLSWGVLVGFS